KDEKNERTARSEADRKPRGSNVSSMILTTPNIEATNGSSLHGALDESSSGGRRAEAVKTVSICDTQPVTTEGIRILLSNCPDLKFLEGTDSLEAAMQLLRSSPPDVLILDKAFGIQAILDWLAAACGSGNESDVRREINASDVAIVVWGVSVTEA